MRRADVCQSTFLDLKKSELSLKNSTSLIVGISPPTPEISNLNLTFKLQISLPLWRVEFLIAYKCNSLWLQISLLLAWDIPEDSHQEFFLVPHPG